MSPLLHIVTNNNDWLWICWIFCRASLLKMLVVCVSVTNKINSHLVTDGKWWWSSIRGSAEFKEDFDPIYYKNSLSQPSYYSWHLCNKPSLDLISKNWSSLISKILRCSRLQIQLSLKFSPTLLSANFLSFSSLAWRIFNKKKC